MALNFLLKRSGTASKRPIAASMALGEVDINYNASTGGLFYKDSAGSVVKVGPAEVGSSAPNSSPVGSAGNSVGEFWYDTANSVLKIWNGSSWVETVSTSGFLSTSGGSMTGNLYISNCELQVDSSGTFTSIGTATFSGTTELNGATSFFFTPTWLENIGPASQVTYDNTASGLIATEVQGAIDELDTNIESAQATANSAIPCSVLTAKGNLLVATDASTPTALPVGTDGQVLTANSACASGVAWAAAGGGGGGSGTVTSITAGTGLTGGTITTSGTIALNSACVISPSEYTSEGTILIGAAGGGTTALSTVSNGRVLTSCSSCTGGVAWIAPAVQAMTPLTTTALTTVTLLSVNAATVRAIKLDLSITNTVTGKYFTDTIWVTHDGSNSNLATTIGARLGASGGPPYTAGSAVVGGNLLITVTPAASSSTKFVGWYELFLI